jgi:hypothetical protein
MWWRLTKAIVVSWLVGVACGALLVVAVQQTNHAPSAVSVTNQQTPQTSVIAPESPQGDAR